MIIFVGNMLMILGIMVMAFYCVWSIREDILSVVVDLKKRAVRKVFLQISSVVAVSGSAVSTMLTAQQQDIQKPMILMVACLHIVLIVVLLNDYGKDKKKHALKLNEDSEELQYSLMSRIVGSRYVFVIVILTLISLGLIQIL